ncbi:uncharacterized protein SOCE26_050940 [Sorangium cellulosum]|uniref:Uncharacterized protein n=1 Tax=Sorangium cellulosum TaxID=56 RepID=A0A2L0EWH4_SORCE|nr:hypothetical protein [Sorangium cellulosum]AUX43642.1 uncharacterized protein SOCE26_050940 [Sorangium cellulosum]
MGTVVTLERYAEMRAEMDTGMLRDEVLARTGLTIDDWIDTQQTWLERMGTELERGRFELTNRYTQAFLERQRALQAAAVPAPVPAPASSPVPSATTTPLPLSIAPPMPPVVVAPVLPLPAISSPFATPPSSRSPFVTPPPEAYPPAPPTVEHDVARTVCAPPSAVARGVLPFATGPQGPNAPKLNAPPGDLGECMTLPIDGGARRSGDALPFKDAPLTARHVRPGAHGEPDLNEHAASQTAMLGPNTPSQTAPPGDLGECMTLPIDGGARRSGDALPFKDAPLAARHVPPGAHDEPDLDEHAASQTAMLAPVAFAGRALPFSSPTGSPQVPRRSPSAPDLPAPRSGAGVLPFVQGSPSAPHPDPAASGGATTGGHSAEMLKYIHSISLAQYAEICATVTALPDQFVQILNHYKMDAHAWTALHAVWQERFQRDPTLRPRWQALVESALSRRKR